MEVVYVIGVVTYVISHVFMKDGPLMIIIDTIMIIAAIIGIFAVSAVFMTAYVAINTWFPSMFPWIGSQATALWTVSQPILSAVWGWIATAVGSVWGAMAETIVAIFQWFMSVEVSMYEKIVTWF